MIKLYGYRTWVGKKLNDQVDDHCVSDADVEPCDQRDPLSPDVGVLPIP